jgi:hypothetical protein
LLAELVALVDGLGGHALAHHEQWYRRPAGARDHRWFKVVVYPDQTETSEVHAGFSDYGRALAEAIRIDEVEGVMVQIEADGEVIWNDMDGPSEEEDHEDRPANKDTAPAPGAA